MKSLLRCFSLTAAFSLAVSLTAQMTLLDYPNPLGVSAPFAGMIGDRLVVAGGCNFPDVPAADGGKKAYTAEVYALSADGRQWAAEEALPLPVAYGATVEVDGGLMCIGGANADGGVTDVQLLTADSEGHLRVTSLTPLPRAIDNGGAARIGTKVYVTGGNQGGERGLYAYDLCTRRWQRLRDYPGQVRQQPVVVGVAGQLYLLGGYDYDKESNTCLTASTVLAYSPDNNRWRKVASLPKSLNGCLVGATGAVNDSSLLVTGGVDANIFRAAVEGRGPADYLRMPVPWYNFNSNIYILTLKRNHWRQVPGPQALARAGGVMVHRGDSYVMVCGEQKPGVRSPRLTAISWPRPHRRR